MKNKNRSMPYEQIGGRNCCQKRGVEPASSVYGMNILIDDDDEVTFEGCCFWCRQQFFTKEKLKRRLPIINWLPNYSLSDLKGDIIAGLSVAFTIIPQGLALATLAGLPAHYGLYSSFMGCFLYAFLGTCKDAAVGPTSILAIIIAPYVATGGATYAILLSFMTGCVMLILGILNLGFVVDFISYPVISSFSTSAAITIATSQLKSFFGVHYFASRFIDTIQGFTKNITLLNYSDTILGILCLAFLVPVQMAKDFHFKEKTPLKNCLNTLWWLVVTGRNAIVVLLTSLVVILCQDQDTSPFTLTNEIKKGLPAFEMPSFSIENNSTSKDFPKVMSDIGSGVFVLALIGLLETVAVAKAFMPSKKLDCTQEMVALGVCNIMGSFVGAFPVTGSFSRSAVNHNSGVKSPLGGIVTGSLVILALATLAPFFELIPQTALSSIIIAAVIPMVRFDDPLIIWRTNRIDLIPYIATLLTCLLIGLEFGIVIGVLSSLVILLYQMARPRVSIVLRMTPEGEPFLYVKPDRSVFFPSVEYLKVKINKALPDVSENVTRTCIVIDGEHMFRSDSTFGVGIKNMVQCFRNQGLLVIFYNLRKPVLRAIRGVSLKAGDFSYSQNEEEVYALIGFHNKRVWHRECEQSLPTNPSHRYWATQSCETL